MEQSYRPVLKDSLYIRLQEYIVVEVVPNTVVQKLCIHFNHIYDEYLDPSCIEQIQIDGLIKEALGCPDLSFYSDDNAPQLNIVFIFPNYSGNDIKKKLLVDGLESLITIFAVHNLFTKINIVGVKYAEDVIFSTLGEIVTFFLTSKMSTILHGNIIPLIRPLESISNQNLTNPLMSPTKSMNNSNNKHAFTLIIDAFEGIGLAIMLALAASTNVAPSSTLSSLATAILGSPVPQNNNNNSSPPMSNHHNNNNNNNKTMNIVATFRPGNCANMDNIYSEISTKYPNVSILCLPFDTYNNESYTQLATAIKDSKIELETIIYSFAKDIYRKMIHPIHINYYIKLFQAMLELNMISHLTLKKIHHVIISSEFSIRPFINPDMMMDYVSNHMELAFVHYLKHFSLAGSNNNNNNGGNNNTAGTPSTVSSPVTVRGCNALLIISSCHEVDRQRKQFYDQSCQEKNRKNYLKRLPKGILIESKEIGQLISFILQYPKEFNSSKFIATAGMHLYYHNLPNPSSERFPPSSYQMNSMYELQITQNRIDEAQDRRKFNGNNANTNALRRGSERGGNGGNNNHGNGNITTIMNGMKNKINFGLSHNRLIQSTVAKYLPEYLHWSSIASIPYTQPTGLNEFKDILLDNGNGNNNNNNFPNFMKREQVLLVHNLPSIFVLLGFHYSKLSFTLERNRLDGREELMKERSKDFEAIQSFSNCLLVDESSSAAHIYYATTLQTSAKDLLKITEFLMNSSETMKEKPLFIVIYSPSQCFPIPIGKKISFIYAASFAMDQTMSCGVLYSLDEQLLHSLEEFATKYLPVSIFLQAAVIHNIHQQHNLSQQSLGSFNNSDPSSSSLSSSLMPDILKSIPIPSMTTNHVDSNSVHTPAGSDSLRVEPPTPNHSLQDIQHDLSAYEKSLVAVGAIKISNSSSNEITTTMTMTPRVATTNDFQNASLEELIHQSFVHDEPDPIKESFHSSHLFLLNTPAMGFFVLAKFFVHENEQREHDPKQEYNSRDKFLLGMDAPFDAEIKKTFEYQRHRAQIMIESYAVDFQKPKNSLLKRIQRAKEDGCRAYLVTNPHSPTGFVYPIKEIEEVCAWHASNQQGGEGGGEEFHLIFDEQLVHCIHADRSMSLPPLSKPSSPSHHLSPASSSLPSPTPAAPPAPPVFHSAIRYADRNPFIHVIRGFSKDMGIKETGVLITSNPRLHALLSSWRKIITPGAGTYSYSILKQLFLHSEFGQAIFRENKRILAARSLVCRQLLEKEKIPFFSPSSSSSTPVAGYAMIISLKGLLEKCPYYYNEMWLWKRCQEKLSLHLLPGKNFGWKEDGWFVIYPLREEDDEITTSEGIRRLGEFLRKEILQDD